MAATHTRRPAVGLAHVTVVPTNYRPPAPEPTTEERDDEIEN